MSNLNKPITSLNTAKPAVKAVVKYLTVQFLAGNQYATARVELLDVDGKVNAAHDVAFTEAELASWGADDTFVLTLALQKLGLTQA